MFQHTNHEVYVATARSGDSISGQIVTWTLPATLVPDATRVVVVLSPLNFTHTLIRETGRFVLHLLAEEQLEWLRIFGLSSSQDVDKFAGIPLGQTRSGLPVLPGTCGWMELRIVDRLDSGDRIIYLCDALEIGQEPLRRPLQLKDAFAHLPPEVVAAFQEKKARDGTRDRAWLKDFGTPKPLRTIVS
jgi:flavin reductase (DIM6/NTAB) family NADH-FMN oxidoreductase RutF